jgi:hypothetical protein
MQKRKRSKHWLLGSQRVKHPSRTNGLDEPRDPEENRRHGFHPIPRLRLGRGRSISRW